MKTNGSEITSIGTIKYLKAEFDVGLLFPDEVRQWVMGVRLM